MGRLTMRKRLLGRTGVLVTEFALGTMTFGQEADEKVSAEILDQYVEAGGNLIDTADVYPPVGPKGTSEQIIGRWLKQRSGARDSLILATKCRGRMDDSGNAEGLSRRWIIRACEMSLRRLQTDYIDLYQAHQWDPAKPRNEEWRPTTAATTSARGGSSMPCRPSLQSSACLPRRSRSAGWPTVRQSPLPCSAPARRPSSATT